MLQRYSHLKKNPDQNKCCALDVDAYVSFPGLLLSCGMIYYFGWNPGIFWFTIESSLIQKPFEK